MNFSLISENLSIHPKKHSIINLHIEMGERVEQDKSGTGIEI